MNRIGKRIVLNFMNEKRGIAPPALLVSPKLVEGDPRRRENKIVSGGVFRNGFGKESGPSGDSRPAWNHWPASADDSPTHSPPKDHAAHRDGSLADRGLDRHP